MENIPTASILNCTTGETITRPLTAEEIEEQEILKANFLQREAEREAAAEAKAALKASAKAKLIAGKPLTAEEADVLVL
jgi:hypothetical protein